MNTGDIVNFHTEAWVFQHVTSTYANPGVVVEVDNTHRQVRYTVLWADGKITKEHNGYLRLQEIANESD